MKQYIIRIYLFVWGVLTYYSLPEESEEFQRAWDYRTLKEVIGALDVGNAVALALLAAYAYYQSRKDEDWIYIVIKDDAGKVIKEPIEAFQREECNRSNVSGVLRSHHDGDSFSIAYLNEPEFLTRVRAIKDGKGSELEIIIRKGDRFKLKESNAGHQNSLPDERIPVFLNLSNHPIEDWPASQLEAARRLHPEAELIDIPFPSVDPVYSTQEVMGLSKKTWEEVKRDLNKNNQKPVGAMVSGEPILCFGFVEQMQRESVKCYSATTSRLSSTDEYGVKSSTFNFMRFREWPKIKDRA